MVEKMTKIKGRFAPLTDELGDDERFIIQSTDLDKLLYLLIIYTCHMTRHKAPKDPKFYSKRFAMRSKLGQISASLGRLAVMYPKLSWGDKTLSLTNSASYRNQSGTEAEQEAEKEEEQEGSDAIFSEEQSRDVKAEIAKSHKWTIMSEATDKEFKRIIEQVEKNKPKNPVGYAITIARGK